MTERSRGAAVQEADQLQIGPSNVRWTGEALEIDIVERDTRLFNPIHRRVRGKLRVIPRAINTVPFGLDPDARHRWHCLAPRARIELRMDEPGISWNGEGYLDSNSGEESLEEGFRVWHWSRAHCREGSVVNYEGVRRDGSHFASALRFAKDGSPEPAELPMVAPLPNTFWQIERKTRADRGHARALDTWEDSPFYARSQLLTQLYGERVVAVQESLDLDRFKSPITQFMLPFRMPRKRG
ncbi:hydroxyneurosporene dehydrogenase [Aurantiacibacter sp. MUD61]|uniref:hydroxyneurosporene dehydrogenase n=1 Tax=Aurantiacibacter sp. MUD61 TaxID=3009083 RepID=UPI0022F0C6B4|nr:hydroxyneurosporene dehydrogenase [Aurantiacibacter sp. MUD61]